MPPLPTYSGPFASRKVENSEAASPNFAIFLPLLATRPKFEPHSVPLKPKATDVHIVGPI